MTAAAAAPDERFEPVPHLVEARRATTAAARLEAIRRAAPGLRDWLRGRGTVRGVRTAELILVPYPTRFALGGAARSPAPYLLMANRMQVVRFVRDGAVRTLLVNPSDFEFGTDAPFFARLARALGERVSEFVMARTGHPVPDRLRELGVDPAEVDYVTFDHLHVQDLRRLLSQWLPRARLLAQRAELETARDPHPFQRPWYVPEALAGVPASRIVALDGDVVLGEGVALLFTPGHTYGNHTIVLSTSGGLWTISENGVSADNYSPRASRIPGVASHARNWDVEVVLNSNSRDLSAEQYTSMVLEKAIADPVPEAPEFVQHFPSSELTPSPLAPLLSPTWRHRAIGDGAL